MIEQGRIYESELRLYTEPKSFEDLKCEPAWRYYLNSIAVRISNDKRDNIVDYIVAPLAVTSITSKLTSDLCRVFNSSDKYFDVNTLTGFAGEKVMKSLENTDVATWIEEQGREIIKNKPCSVIVVDRDNTGLAYPVLVDSDRIVDYELTKDKKAFVYISFIHSVSLDEEGVKEERFSVYDDINYNVVLRKRGNYTIERSEAHNVGYCPASFFIDKPLNSNNEYKRANRFYSSLSLLEQCQTLSIFKYYTDHHVPYPTVEMVKESCINPKCKNGKVEHQFPTSNRLELIDCPDCNGRLNNLKLGSMILLDAQLDNDDPSASGKYKEHYPDVSCLEYLNESIDRLEKTINDKVIGSSFETNKVAINEDQVNSSVESKKNIYLELKSNLDSVYVWLVETIAFASDKNAKIDVFADWGNEWYLFSEDDLLERYEKAKKEGLPKSELDSIFLEYLSTKYKGDNRKATREKLIFKLNPDPHSTLDQKISKIQNFLQTKEDIVLSENISTFVKQFEAEKKVSINDFGEALEEKLRINKIKEELYKITENYISNDKNKPATSDREI